MKKRCSSYKLCRKEDNLCLHHVYHECDENDNCYGHCGSLGLTTICEPNQRKQKLEKINNISSDTKS